MDTFGKQNSPSGGYQWFDPNSFGPAVPGTFGTCGVGTVRGPGLHTLDFSLAKFFEFTERQKLEFRAEAINLTNTPILNSPNAGLGNTLGLVNSSQGARNIQLTSNAFLIPRREPDNARGSREVTLVVHAQA